MESDEVVAQMVRLKPYFGSEGGLTLSGGEPLMQAPFALEILRGCRAEGIHTALDTCGFYLDETVKHCLRHTDLVLLDIKHSDPDRHKALTGHHMDRMLRFVEYLAEKRSAVWVRHVVVPGWTDGEEDLRGLLSIARMMPGLQMVELLPYHRMARDKWQALGVPYPWRQRASKRRDDAEAAGDRGGGAVGRLRFPTSPLRGRARRISAGEGKPTKPTDSPQLFLPSPRLPCLGAQRPRGPRVSRPSCGPRHGRMPPHRPVQARNG